MSKAQVSRKATRMVGGSAVVSSLYRKLWGVVHANKSLHDKETQATHEDVLKTFLEHRACGPVSRPPVATATDLLPEVGLRTLVVPCHPGRRSSIQIKKTSGKRGELVVAYVWRNGPCGKAGLRLGDVIVAVNGVQPKEVDQVQEMLAGHDDVSITVSYVV